MTQYPHLANFNTTEGHWQDRNLFRPIIQDIYNKYNVKSILEIGFNIGYSASMWLEFDYDKKSTLTSVDIGIHKDTEAAAAAVKNLHKERFSFILSDSKKVKKQLQGQLFDLAFIDGDHTHQGVQNDIQSCINLKIPYLLFDDWHTYDEHGRYTNGVKTTCDMFEKAGKISKVEIFDLKYDTDKLALYKNDTIYSTKKLLTKQIQLLSPKRD